MATKAKDSSENDRIRVVIGQLRAALEQCDKLLDHDQPQPCKFTQDNDPD
jgi:hypothetical protein